MSYFIIRKEFTGLSYSLTDMKPDYTHGENPKGRKARELVFELSERGNCASLSLLKHMAQHSSLYPSPYVKWVLNIPKEPV